MGLSIDNDPTPLKLTLSELTKKKANQIKQADINHFQRHFVNQDWKEIVLEALELEKLSNTNCDMLVTPF